MVGTASHGLRHRDLLQPHRGNGSRSRCSRDSNRLHAQRRGADVERRAFGGGRAPHPALRPQSPSASAPGMWSIFVPFSTSRMPRSPCRTVSGAAKKLGMDVSPHDFRHFRARQMLEQGAPLEAIQEILGHSDIGTTRRVYAHYSKPSIRSIFERTTLSPEEAARRAPDE